MKNFNNKVAAITGAGSGIGQQLAVLLAQQGCHLALSDISMNRVWRKRSNCSKRVMFVSPFRK